jgi:hypothetical protein
MDRYPADFISGAVAMGYLVVGLFFLKFWRRTGDGLFLIFAVAFWLLMATTATFVLGGIARGSGWVYLPRLAAFILIIAGIVGKNIRASKG